jgi:cell division protein WhiA
VSFSSGVKEELSRFEERHPCCRKSELAALLRVGLSIRRVGGVSRLLFISENALLSRHVFSVVKELYHSGPEVVMLKTHRFRDHAVYRLDFSAMVSPSGAAGLLSDCGIMATAESHAATGEAHEGLSLRSSVEPQVLSFLPWKAKSRCCRRAYLRGCFLAGGSISDPDRSYHLEISFPNRMLFDEFHQLLLEYGIAARDIVRKGHLMAYLKEGQEIVDFLNITGAHGSLMQLENIRIMKDMRNQVNRIVNCETANLEKTVNASFRQMDSIQYLETHVGLDSLPDGLRDVARLRLAHSEVSLQELGEMLSPGLTKSGVNHRLRKLERMADELRTKNGE